MKETRNWKEPCQHASCRLGDEEEVKEERERRGEKRWVDVERSGSSDHTSCIQEPVSAESISSDSAMFSLARYVLCSSAFLPRFFFHFILRSHWGDYWWGTSCSMFSFSLWALSLTTPRELWTDCGAFEDSAQSQNQKGFFLVTKPTTECSISPCPCNYPLFSDTLLILKTDIHF